MIFLRVKFDSTRSVREDINAHNDHDQVGHDKEGTLQLLVTDEETGAEDHGLGLGVRG